MTHTHETYALILDPQRARAGWWKDEVDIEDRTIYPASIPALTTDDAAAFAHVRPVLLAAGCEIAERPTGREGLPYAVVFYRQCQAGNARHYAAALCAALAWLRDNQPEVLSRAIAQVREKA